MYICIETPFINCKGKYLCFPHCISFPSNQLCDHTLYHTQAESSEPEENHFQCLDLCLLWTNMQAIKLLKDHVSYEGPRPMYWPIYRLIHQSILDRVSVDTRSSINRYIGRVLTDVSTDTHIGRYTWWRTETSPILEWYFTDTAPMLHRHFTFTECIGWYWSIYRSIHWLTLNWSINALVSVDVSANTLVYTPIDSIKYRAIYRWIVSSITDSISR